MKSHAMVYKDFQTDWYKRWAKRLKQNKDHLDGFALFANKFWQNAAICQALEEAGALQQGKHGVGFGVGQERLPAALATLGVKVTATDQDYRQRKAQNWSAAELARGLESLNRLHIATSEQMLDHVSFRSVDMNNVPEELNGKYDFAWSNCALGHLGSIPAGLAFIRRSLDCLRPGGVAVHTTELNIASNDQTVEAGDTVIFRLKDIHRLQTQLNAAGYRCKPLQLDLGTQPGDARISMRPQFGNDYSKIQVGGHVATQIILVIERPTRRWFGEAAIHDLRLRIAYRRNRRQLTRFRHRNPDYRAVTKASHTAIKHLRITPLKPELSVSVKRGESAELLVPYLNQSPVSLFAKYGRLAQAKPILLGTADPHDRPSRFADKTWIEYERNRASSDLRQPDGTLADHVQPGEAFAFNVSLTAKNIKLGEHIEAFAIVQEDNGWVADSEVTVRVNVIK